MAAELPFPTLEPGSGPTGARTPAAEAADASSVLTALLELNPGGVAVVQGPELRLVAANAAFRRFVEDPGQDPVGHTVREVLPPEEGFEAHVALQRVLDAGEPIAFETERHEAGSAARTFSTVARRIEWNGADAALLVIWETTALAHARLEAEEARRRAERSAAAERRIADRFARLHATTAALSAALTPRDVAEVIAARGLAALPDASAALVSFLTEDGGALALAAARGVAPAVEARSAWIPVDGEGALAAAHRERRALFLPDRESVEGHAPAFGGGAQEGILAAAALPLAVGSRPLGAVLFGFVAPQPFEDEERAFLEAFVHQCAQALERARLYEAERAARLEAQRAEESARRAVELQERLVGVVGHDLRTPLAAIQMATSLLFRRGGLSEEQARTLARLGASANRMTAIIRDLLDFTRVRKEGVIPVEPRGLDLAEVCRRTVAELQEVHPDRTIALTASSAVPMVGDPERLGQVVSNLVGNAVQHSPGSSAVSVRLRATDEEAVLAVHNAGPPIPRELLSEIFEPFRQAHIAADASGSIGLGLFIVRELVRAHGGSVEARSSAEAGTTFTVRLPRASGAGGA